MKLALSVLVGGDALTGADVVLVAFERWDGELVFLLEAMNLKSVIGSAHLGHEKRFSPTMLSEAVKHPEHIVCEQAESITPSSAESVQDTHTLATSCWSDRWGDVVALGIDAPSTEFEGARGRFETITFKSLTGTDGGEKVERVTGDGRNDMG